MTTPDEQDALTVEDYEVVAAEPMVAAIRAVDIDTVLDVSKDGDWELECPVGLDEIERVV